jgi:hypothetical protein
VLRDFEHSLQLANVRLQSVSGTSQQQPHGVSSALSHNPRLSRLARLRHQCAPRTLLCGATLFHQHAEDATSGCECEPVMAIVLQALFELVETEHEAAQVLELLSSMYGDMEHVPLSVFALCMNLLLVKHYGAVSYKKLRYFVESQTFETLQQQGSRSEDENEEKFCH